MDLVSLVSRKKASFIAVKLVPELQEDVFKSLMTKTRDIAARMENTFTKLANGITQIRDFFVKYGAFLGEFGWCQLRRSILSQKNVTAFSLVKIWSRDSTLIK